MRNTVIFFISAMLFFGCASQRGSSGKQGIIGEVRWVEGNLMPTIGDNSYAHRAFGIPIVRDIYIFSAVKRDDTISAGGSFYKSVNGKLVARLKSNREGIFKVDLPIGTYSIFVMEDQGYYANVFDGNGYINPVTVHANNFTEIKILVNYKAVY